MVIYTVVPGHILGNGLEEEGGAGRQRRLIEIESDGCRILVEPTAEGQGRVVRLVSTCPSDYLRPEFQPGRIIPLGR